jgi:hypothetical protein
MLCIYHDLYHPDVNDCASDFKGKGRGVLCNDCWKDFQDGKMTHFSFNEQGAVVEEVVTDYYSMECQCNCFGVFKPSLLDAIEAWSDGKTPGTTAHPDLLWMYPSKTTTKTEVALLRESAVKATSTTSQMTLVEARKKTNAQLLSICTAEHKDNFKTPQELQAMVDPATPENQRFIQWGLAQRGISDLDFESVYIRGLQEHWFDNVPATCSVAPSCAPNCDVLVDWNHARLALIYVILYGIQIAFVRKPMADAKRFPFRIVADPELMCGDTMHGGGRIGMREIDEVRNGMLRFRPPGESTNATMIKVSSDCC